MKTKVGVTIAGLEYTITSDQEAAFVEKIAAHVDAKVREVTEGTRLSVADGAILAAMNIAEDFFDEAAAAENLRRQLKDYAEETSALKQELSEAKREIFKLENKK